MYVNASDALEIKWGYSISVPVPFPSLRAIWEAAPRQGITSTVGSKCITHPFKIKFHGWWEVQDVRVIRSLCVIPPYCYSGTFCYCPWLFLPDSWQLDISLHGQKLSECMFIHLANVLFPLCLSQPKHALNGRHQPKCPGSHRSPHPCLNIW